MNLVVAELFYSRQLVYRKDALQFLKDKQFLKQMDIEKIKGNNNNVTT